MNSLLNPARSARSWPNKRPNSPRSSLLSVSLLCSAFFVLSYFTFAPKSLLSASSKTLNPQSPQCGSRSRIQAFGESFMWYAPHSGFGNQVSEFRNAILMAAILNRTLIVPPVLDHHAVALGSCPKFRVLGAKEIRVAVWNHIVELIREGRYVSMADIVDISSLVSSSMIRIIDFRVFASLWCGVNIDLSCSSSQSNSQSTLIYSLQKCGPLLSGFDGNVGKCLYAVDEDCKTTVWTYKKGDEDGSLDSFQPDEELKRKKKISYVRTRRDVYKSLGPGSEAQEAAILAFGSLFTSPYKGSQLHIDIHESPSDQRIQSVIEKIQYLPFVPEIMNAGKEFAVETIKAPFLCAQLRLLDGQFKNHRKATFLGLKEKIESSRQKGPLPVNIFVMTDLPEGNWTGSYLGDLARDKTDFRLHFLKQDDELVIQTAKNLVSSGHGLRLGAEAGTGKKYCPRILPDVLLYLEETICSCASLGFVGTAGSTIAENIELMRKFGKCSG